MKALKNIFVGFLVSFVGSIPLGYLNVIGFEIYTSQGILQTLCYLIGVIFIEFFVVYFTLLFTNVLAKNAKLNKTIEGFSVLFMFILAFVFYFTASNNNSQDNVFSNLNFLSAFSTGVFLSAINFIQIPFWTGWNLYLIKQKYIEISKYNKYFYVFGTLTGTLFGMLTLILSLHYFSENVDFISKYLLRVIIPLVFLVLGIFQGLKFYKKYYKSKN